MDKPTRLMNRHFFLLWQGQFVSQIGSQAFIIATMFAIKHETESASLLGLMVMASTLPGVILGPIGGTLADRYSRRKIILVNDILCGLAVLLLAGLMFVNPGNKGLILVSLFLASVIVGVTRSFFRPAFSAAIPDIVPADKVARANSLYRVSYQLSMFLGQGLGGVLFRILGAPMLFLADGLSYLFAAICESPITIPQKIPEKSMRLSESFFRFRKDTLEGFRYVWGRVGLRYTLFTGAFVNLFMTPVILLLPFYVEDVLKARTDWYGFLIAAFSIGTVIGNILAGLMRFSARVRARLTITFLIFHSLTVGLLGLTNSLTISLILVLLTGMLNGFIGILFLTVLQITTPNEIRGRVFGLFGTLVGGLAPIGVAVSSVAADLTGKNIPLIYLACGVIMIFFSLLISMSPRFRDYIAYEEPSSHSRAAAAGASEATRSAGRPLEDQEAIAVASGPGR